MAEKFTGYVVKVYTDKNIYSLTYGDEKKDMEYNPTICPPDAPVPPEPTPTKKLPQNIVWTQDIKELYVGETIELIAYATSNLPVSFKIEEGGTIAHLNGNRLTADKEGGIIVLASQGGDDTYYAADNVIKAITLKVQPEPIVKKEQTINWSQIIDLHEGENIVLGATATSGLPVQYSIVSGLENARLIGNTLYGVNEGEVVVRAYQLGNDEYKSAEPITKPIRIQKKEQPTPTKQDQAIVWEQAISIKVGDVVSLSATATSGLPVSYVVTLGNELVSINGNELKALGEGTVIVKAVQEGNDEYNAAEPKTKGFTIEKSAEVDGFFVVQFDKNYVDPSDRPFSTLEVVLPQGHMKQVLWETDDLKSYLADAVDPMGDGIVTLSVPFEQLEGTISHNIVCAKNTTDKDNGCDYVVASYFMSSDEKNYIDFENVNGLGGGFGNLEEANGIVFRKDNDNIVNTHNIVSLYSMFANDFNIAQVNLSNLNFTKVRDYTDMFRNCFNLGLVNLRNTHLKTSSVNYSDMFKGCGRDVARVNVVMAGCTQDEINFIKKAWADSGNDINKLTIQLD